MAAPTATDEVLPSCLAAYRARWPEVRLDLEELRSGLQPEALRSGRIEVGLACGPLREAGLTEVALSRERFLAALPRRHPLAARARLRLRDLDGRPGVAVRPSVEPAWARAADEALARAGVRLDLVQETDTKIALLGLVAAGIGLALVSASMRRLARDGVVYREIADLGVRVPLVALLQERPSPRAAALLALAPRAPGRGPIAPPGGA